MSNKIWYIVLIGVFFLACKKEELPELPEENEPFYHIAGLVNSDSINWKVGMDGNVLTYGVDDVNGVPSYFGQITHGITGDVIRIEIVRPEIFSDGTEITAFTNANLDYLVHEAGSIKFNFGISYGQFNFVEAQDASGGFQPVSQIDLAEFGRYKLPVKFTDFSTTEIFSFPVKYGFEDELLKTGFYSGGENDTLKLTPQTTEGSHRWFINGSLISEESTVTMPIENGIYTVKHEITDVNGNTGDHETLIRIKNGSHYWQMKYYYIPPYKPSSNYGTVKVSMKKNEVWYCSEHTPSNLENKFTISNIATQISLGSGYSKTAFDFIFKSVLHNPDQSDSLYLPEMQGRIAVEFK